MRCRRTMASATRRPRAVSRAPARGAWATSPSAASRPSMPVTEGAETASRSASREVGTGPPPGASA